MVMIVNAAPPTITMSHDRNTSQSGEELIQLVSLSGDSEQSEDTLSGSALVTETHPEVCGAENIGDEHSVSQSASLKMKSVRIQYMSIKNWINILLLGMGFLLLFTSFQTSAFVQVRALCK